MIVTTRTPSRTGRVALAALVLGLAALPLLPTPAYWVTIGNYIGLYALVALGLVLLTGVAGLTSFGQAAFVGLGAYATGWLTVNLGLDPWLALPAGMAITGLSALAIGAITLRMSGHYLPLATIAWGISLYYLFGTLPFLGRHDGLQGIPPVTVAGVSFAASARMFWLIWAAVLVGVLCVRNLLDSRPGRAIRALNGGTRMAEAMGVDTGAYKIVAFVFAAVLAAVSGWLYAHLQRTVNPTPFALNMGIEYLFMAVVGGVGHVWGAVLGATLLTVVKDQLQVLLPALFGRSGNYEIIVFGAVLVLLLQHARDGLWPLVLRLFERRATATLADDPAQAAGAAHAADSTTGATTDSTTGATTGVPVLPQGLEAAAALPRRERPAAGAAPVLEVIGARKQFGGLVAVNDIGFAVRAGEIVGLIGPNGAGKSTCFNLITGVLPLTAGEVRFGGRRIDGLPSRRIAAMGVSRTFQHVKLIPTMSVLENVALGAHLRARAGVLAATLRLDRRAEARLLAEAARQLERVGLAAHLHDEAGSLPLGKQRVVEIARALAADPTLLLLDEPAAGLRFREKQALAELLRRLRDEGMSILLVEHDMEFVMGLTNHVVVMEFGTKIAEGAPERVQQDPAVIEAYLGGVA